jgi:hypothetical protein
VRAGKCEVAGCEPGNQCKQAVRKQTEDATFRSPPLP